MVWRPFPFRLWQVSALLLLLMAAWPAQAAVTLTFWSRELGNYFPHAFVTLKGGTDDGEAVDTSYGFTARSIGPSILFGSVKGRIDITNKQYMTRSHALFSVVLTDEQYRAVRRLRDEWDAETGDATYNMNRRNCVHFVGEVARRAGLMVEEPKRLMKRPTSFTRSLAALNPDRATVIEMDARDYWAQRPELEPFNVPARGNDPMLDRAMPAKVVKDGQASQPATVP